MKIVRLTRKQHWDKYGPSLERADQATGEKIGSKYYHVSRLGNVRSILRQGLIPNRGVIQLWGDLEDAKSWAESASLERDMRGRRRLGKLAILEVRLPEGARYTSERFVTGVSSPSPDLPIAVLETIPPSNIKHVLTYDIGENTYE